MAQYKGKCHYVNCAMEFDDPQDLYEHFEESHMSIPFELMPNVLEGQRSAEAGGDLLDDAEQTVPEGGDEQLHTEAEGLLEEEETDTESEIEDEAAAGESPNEASESAGFPEGGHDDASRMPICPVPDCQKTFTKFSSILYHMRHCHRNQSVFSCTICERSFMSFGNLKNHVEHHQLQYE